MADETFDIIDRNGTAHEFPVGFDPKRAALIVSRQMLAQANATPLREPTTYDEGERASVADTMGKAGAGVLRGLNPVPILNSIAHREPGIPVAVQDGRLVDQRPKGPGASAELASLSDPSTGGEAIGNLGQMLIAGRVPDLPLKKILRGAGTAVQNYDLTRPMKPIGDAMQWLGKEQPPSYTPPVAPNTSTLDTSFRPSGYAPTPPTPAPAPVPAAEPTLADQLRAAGVGDAAINKTLNGPGRPPLMPVASHAPVVSSAAPTMADAGQQVFNEASRTGVRVSPSRITELVQQTIPPHAPVNTAATAPAFAPAELPADMPNVASTPLSQPLGTPRPISLKPYTAQLRSAYPPTTGQMPGTVEGWTSGTAGQGTAETASARALHREDAALASRFKHLMDSRSSALIPGTVLGNALRKALLEKLGQDDQS